VIDTNQPPHRGRGGLYLVQGAAGFHDHHVADAVHATDAAHALEGDDDVEVRAQRRSATGKSSAAAARDDWRPGRGAGTDHVRHLFGVARTDYEDGRVVCRAGEIAAVGCDVMRRVKHAIGAGDSP
jgi:hypothetical protein